MRDTPQISSASYNTATTALNNMQGFGNASQQQATSFGNLELYQAIQNQGAGFSQTMNPALDCLVKDQKEPEMSVTRRLVQVIIVDPNDNIPLDQCLLYHGEPKLTDATDQELFYEIEIKDLLAKHNQNRVKVVDKKVKERTEHLEPAKIRDLKMVVVTIASF